MNILTKKLSLSAVLAVVLPLALPLAATAAPIVLTLTAEGQQEVGPQSASNPCIIAATQCQQPAGFGFNNFTASGAITDYDMYSTTPTDTVADGVLGDPYTVAQIEALGSSAFLVAIDVNTTSAASETLELFEVIINGVVEYVYNGPTAIGGISNNGNGYADWTLGVVDLSGFADSATVLFHAVWSGAVDGGESFFIVPSTPTGTPVPEPASLFLLGSGLSSLAFAVRRNRNRNKKQLAS